jgi:hypothetical protein
MLTEEMGYKHFLLQNSYSCYKMLAIQQMMHLDGDSMEHLNHYICLQVS